MVKWSDRPVWFCCLLFFQLLRTIYWYTWNFPTAYKDASISRSFVECVVAHEATTFFKSSLKTNRDKPLASLLSICSTHLVALAPYKETHFLKILLIVLPILWDLNETIGHMPHTCLIMFEFECTEYKNVIHIHRHPQTAFWIFKIIFAGRLTEPMSV